MSKKYILSIDQGTTGTTALLIDSSTLKIVNSYNQEFRQIYPNPGWIEHDLDDIWYSVEKTIKEVLLKSKVPAKSILAIGITNQRETTCAFDKKGNPLAHAIVWQDRRTAKFCDEHKKEFKTKFLKTAGLPLDPYFSATKMKWLLENDEDVKQARDKGNLLFGTIDTFLVYKMTKGKSYFTEPSNASRTLLMNLKDCDWDQKLLDFFGISQDSLPKIQDSFGEFGVTSGMENLPDGIPIMSILGDQQSALFGQAGYKKGEMKCTYGTGAFLLLNTGTEAIFSQNGLLTTVAYRHKGETYYALEGSTYIAGAAVQWLRDNLKIIQSSKEIEGIAKKVRDLHQMEDLLFFPFFTGIGTPYWNSEAKGAIIGLTRGTNNEQIARACLEGIALSINDSIQSLIKDSKGEVSSLKVDGGACANNLLMELQANTSGLTILRPEVIETTAYGVALGALIGSGEIEISKLDELWKIDKEFIPEDKNDYLLKKQQLWANYIKKILA